MYKVKYANGFEEILSKKELITLINLNQFMFSFTSPEEVINIIKENQYINVQGLITIEELKDLLPPTPDKDLSYCFHPRKYKNIISNSLKFYFCPDCKKDLGDCHD